MELCVSLGCFACVETSSRSILTSTSSVAAFFLFDIYPFLNFMPFIEIITISWRWGASPMLFRRNT